MRPSNSTAHAANTVGIHPEVVYPRDAFTRASGISKSRLREARLMGLPLPYFCLGRRQFVRGRDAIQWMEELAILLAEREVASV